MIFVVVISYLVGTSTSLALLILLMFFLRGGHDSRFCIIFRLFTSFLFLGFLEFNPSVSKCFGKMIIHCKKKVKMKENSTFLFPKSIRHAWLHLIKVRCNLLQDKLSSQVESTAWKFEDFSGTLNLREISFNRL